MFGAAERLAESDLGVEGLALSAGWRGSGTHVKVDLTLSFGRDPRGPRRGREEYAADLFDPATVERFLSHLRNLLAGAWQSQVLSSPGCT